MLENLLLFIMTRIKITSVWKTAFVSDYFDTVQFQSTKCFSLMHALPDAVLAMPACSSAQAKHTKHIVDCLSYVLSNVHTFALTQMTSV